MTATQETQSDTLAPSVLKAQVEDVVLDPKHQAQIEAESEKWLGEVLSQGVNTPAFKEAVTEIASVGQEDVSKASEVSHRLLQRPSARGGKDSPATKVGNDLVTLRVAVTELDPKRVDLKGIAKIMRFLPGTLRRRVEAFAHRLDTAQDQLGAISDSLTEGQKSLRQDNLAITLERRAMWEAMQALAEVKVYVEGLVEATKAEIARLRANGEEEVAQSLEADVLFALNQRHQDLMTQAAVNAQGYLALDVVYDNNEELIKGVERAKTTTMTALRTGMVTAQALAQQGLVLNQVTTLNEATSNLLVDNSERLKDQAAKISNQASSTTIDMSSLEKALNNVLQTVDAIDAYRTEANPKMESAVATLESQIVQAGEHLRHGHPVHAATDGAATRRMP